MMQKTIKNRAYLVAKIVFALLLAAIMLLPFLWMISTSFKFSKDTISYPPSFFPEGGLMGFAGFENYLTVLNDIPFFRFLLNSIVTAVSVTAGTLITSTLAGYIFAKHEFRGREVWFLLILGTMMIPFDVQVIPLYLMVRSFGLLNNLLALILPGLVSAYGIFLCRQFISGIPTALVDAARIDGSSELGIYIRIILPLSVPVMSALGIFTFMANWDSFLWPLLVIDNLSRRTLPLGLSLFRSQFGTAKWNVIMASTVLSILPVMLVFLLAQRNFIEGITLSGMKL